MRRRVVTAMTAVALLALLLFALPLGVAIEHRQRDQDRRELIQLAALSANRATAERLARRLPPDHYEAEQQVGLYDAGGRRIDGEGPRVLERGVRPVLEDRIVDTRTTGLLVTAVPLLDPTGDVSGAVRVAEPLAEGRARVHSAWLRLGLLGLLADAAALVAALALARRLTQPLAELAQVATRIGDGDFTTAAPPTGLSEVDRVGAALSSTAARLSDMVAREQAFSADASHQLRSPLAALRITVEGELAHPREDPAVVLQEALTEIERLELTIDQLLALARERSPAREPIDLDVATRALSDRWARYLESQGRRLVTASDPEPVVARASGAAVSHVLDVLVDNARMHGGGDIVVATRSHHGAVSVTVTDRGPGVAHPEALFVRPTGEGTGSGNGIGLPLARRLAEAEGGRLVLKRNGPETVFELTLPAG